MPRRLFFAIRPGPPARRALHQAAKGWARAAGGRPVPAGRIHLTLLFLGPVPDARVPALCEAASQVRAEPFALTLDAVGAFRRVGVGWAGVREAPEALLALQAGLAQAVREAGFAIDDRAYVPHVTLVRKLGRTCREVPGLGPPAWPVRRFSLLASEAGRPGYGLHGSWRLDGAARGNEGRA